MLQFLYVNAQRTDVIMEMTVHFAVSTKIHFIFYFFFKSSILETKCYDCGNNDQCADEEDNGKLRSCETGSMCYHISGSKICIILKCLYSYALFIASEKIKDEKYTLRGCMVPPTKESGCHDTSIYGVCNIITQLVFM